MASAVGQNARFLFRIFPPGGIREAAPKRAWKKKKKKKKKEKRKKKEKKKGQEPLLDSPFDRVSSLSVADCPSPSPVPHSPK